VRVISSEALDERYIEVLRLLEPYHYFKFATIPWLHYLSDIKVEYSVFRKYLGYLRQAPNRYVSCPEQQNASPNVDRKTLVYELAPRGLTELLRRGLTASRGSYNYIETLAFPRRAFPFAAHRSAAYYHEIIVDLGYFAPLRYLVRNDPNLRLLDFAQLMQHRNVPQQTREAKDPLLVILKEAQVRFDGAPHLLIRKGAREKAPLTLGIPGIQVDRGTTSIGKLESHLLHAIEFIDERHYERHWGFDNCVVPFLFTTQTRKERAMQFIRARGAHCPFLLFRTIPDFGLLRHFPRPEHYAPNYHYTDEEPRHPDAIHLFTTPWQRVGFADFFLSTFDEGG
jgi:hypothetical protein